MRLFLATCFEKKRGRLHRLRAGRSPRVCVLGEKQARFRLVRGSVVNRFHRHYHGSNSLARQMGEA